MNDENYPDDTFYEQIKGLTLPELEELIESLCTKKLGWIYTTEHNREKINVCLRQRCFLLNNLFECTPENIERLHCVANLIKDRTAMLYKKGNQLYRQMWRLWQANQNEPFTDFYIELELNISYNDEHSVLHLPDDSSGSNYHLMSEVLDSFYYKQYLIENLIMSDTIDYDPERENQTFQFHEFEGIIDSWDEPWFFEKFPKLIGLPITWEFHNLLFHSHYALQDIIRINDVWSEAKAVWQHIAGQKI